MSTVVTDSAPVVLEDENAGLQQGPPRVGLNRTLLLRGAIVAIVVLVLVALGVFVYWDERGARTPDVNVQVERNAEAPPPSPN